CATNSLRKRLPHQLAQTDVVDPFIRRQMQRLELLENFGRYQRLSRSSQFSNERHAVFVYTRMKAFGGFLAVRSVQRKRRHYFLFAPANQPTTFGFVPSARHCVLPPRQSRVCDIFLKTPFLSHP